MILLSNVYKFSQVENDKKVITTKPITMINEAVVIEQDVKTTIIDEMSLLEQQKNDLIQQIELLRQEQERLLLDQMNQRELFQKELDQNREVQENEIRMNADHVFTEANQQGFEQGYETGYQQAMNDWQEKNQEIEQILRLAYAEKESIIQEAEPFLLNLSISIARKIIGAELDLNPEKIVEMIKQGLSQVRERNEIVLQVSPGSYPLILGQLEELKYMIDPNSELKVIPDHSYSGQGCMIHTSGGSYDVTIDSQLMEIKKQLLNHFEERAGS